MLLSFQLWYILSEQRSTSLCGENVQRYTLFFLKLLYTENGNGGLKLYFKTEFTSGKKLQFSGEFFQEHRQLKKKSTTTQAHWKLPFCLPYMHTRSRIEIQRHLKQHIKHGFFYGIKTIEIDGICFKVKIYRIELSMYYVIASLRITFCVVLFPDMLLPSVLESSHVHCIRRGKNRICICTFICSYVEKVSILQ